MTLTQPLATRSPDLSAGQDHYRVTIGHRANAKTWARTFEARMLEPGIVSYEDQGCGKAFLTKESIERSMPTFIGRPLILTPKLKHQKMTPADLEKHARGYITDWYYGTDGWFWVKGICHDDEAKAAIDRVKLCSCAYDVVSVGPGGEYHAIPYHEEILSFSGEHLAIVDRPRYEEATIRLNSKNKTTMKLKFWEKPASRQNAEAPIAAPAAAAAPAATETPAPVSKENSVAPEITGDTKLTIPSLEAGKTEDVTLEQLVTAYNARNDGPDLDREIDVAGKPVKLSALIDAHQKLNALPEESDEDKKKRENSEKEEADKKAKENAKAPSHFRVLLNARAAGTINEGPRTGPDDIVSRCNRGSERYGSVVVAGKN